jgi:hypothetical protein
MKNMLPASKWVPFLLLANNQLVEKKLLVSLSANEQSDVRFQYPGRQLKPITYRKPTNILHGLSKECGLQTVQVSSPAVLKSIEVIMESLRYNFNRSPFRRLEWKRIKLGKKIAPELLTEAKLYLLKSIQLYALHLKTFGF